MDIKSVGVGLGIVAKINEMKARSDNPLGGM